MDFIKLMRFKKPKYVGDPINAVRIFSRKEVDEIMLLDIRETSKKTGNQIAVVKKICFRMFCPLLMERMNNMHKAEKIFFGSRKISIRNCCAQ